MGISSRTLCSVQNTSPCRQVGTSEGFRSAAPDGSIGQFEADNLAGMTSGTIDRRDMPVVLASVHRGVREGL